MSIQEKLVDVLQIYHHDNKAEGVLDDELSDHFDAWLEDQKEANPLLEEILTEE